MYNRKCVIDYYFNEHGDKDAIGRPTICYIYTTCFRAPIRIYYDEWNDQHYNTMVVVSGKRENRPFWAMEMRYVDSEMSYMDRLHDELYKPKTFLIIYKDTFEQKIIQVE